MMGGHQGDGRSPGCCDERSPDVFYERSSGCFHHFLSLFRGDRRKVPIPQRVACHNFLLHQLSKYTPHSPPLGRVFLFSHSRCTSLVNTIRAFIGWSSITPTIKACKPGRKKEISTTVTFHWKYLGNGLKTGVCHTSSTDTIREYGMGATLLDKTSYHSI